MFIIDECDHYIQHIDEFGNTVQYIDVFENIKHLVAGMMLGAVAVGVHMAMTHAICLSMLSAYIPATEVPGLGRVSGTVWSFTDFVLGKTASILFSIHVISLASIRVIICCLGGVVGLAGSETDALCHVVKCVRTLIHLSTLQLYAAMAAAHMQTNGTLGCDTSL